MSDRFTEQLSPYLDGELDDLARARLETHLAECLDCTRTLAEVRAILAAAPDYVGREPSRDLWQEIVARLGEAEVIPLPPNRPTALPPSRHRFGWRELIAASIVMAAVGGGSVWFALSRPAADVETAVVSPAAPLSPAAGGTAVGFAEQEYDAAVRDLEQVLEAGRDRLDSATVRTIEQSIVRIDAAIAEARAAIQRDPSSSYLSRQIAANMRRKLNLLRVATQAIAART
jgi:anti-sigma factor RsiW